jgi:hypothetical protein
VVGDPRSFVTFTAYIAVKLTFVGRREGEGKEQEGGVEWTIGTSDASR